MVKMKGSNKEDLVELNVVKNHEASKILSYLQTKRNKISFRQFSLKENIIMTLDSRQTCPLLEREMLSLSSKAVCYASLQQ